jgi:uncharacterized membrane protein YfcA
VPDLAHVVLFIVLGGVVGALGGLFGIGGGLIAIPILGLFFGLDQQHAQGTALIMVSPTVLIGLWNYARYAGFDRRVAATLAATAPPLTFVGAYVAVHVPSRELRIGFGAFLAILAAWFAIRSLRRPPKEARRAVLAWGWSAVLGTFGGCISGLFSVGGAAFAVPFLSAFFGFSQATAQGLGLALVAPGTIVGIVTYALAHDVEWAVGIPMAIGAATCVRFGVRLAHALPDRTLRLLFCGLLAASSAALLLKSTGMSH